MGGVQAPIKPQSLWIKCGRKYAECASAKTLKSLSFYMSVMGCEFNRSLNVSI